jgi:hypothetical protein
MVTRVFKDADWKLPTSCSCRLRVQGLYACVPLRNHRSDRSRDLDPIDNMWNIAGAKIAK